MGKNSSFIEKYSPYYPYVLPFTAFMVFTEIGNWIPGLVYYLYPVKTIVTAGILLYYWKYYRELKLGWSAFPLFCGIAVFVIWVGIDNFYPKISGTVYDPYIFESKRMRAWIIFNRMIGSVIVVPVMEELFWRSFILRFLINQDFKKVSLGTFNWSSFIISSLLFGAEHNRWLAGIIAGAIYNIVLYHRKELSDCIAAHAVTNFLLGIFVISSGNYEFW